VNREFDRGETCAGDEVTCVYTTWTCSALLVKTQFPSACLCCSPRCRGILSENDWQGVELQQRYERHYQSFILGLIDRHTRRPRE